LECRDTPERVSRLLKTPSAPDQGHSALETSDRDRMRPRL